MARRERAGLRPGGGRVTLAEWSTRGLHCSGNAVRALRFIVWRPGLSVQ
jgi:hypothetical protein